NPFYLAIRADALIVAGGEDGLKALKETLVQKPAQAPLLRFEASLARLAPVMSRSKKGDPVEAARKAFSGADKNNDSIQLTVEGGEALKVRLRVKEPVIKFFRMID